MNAGKSTLLLQSAHNYKERGMDTLIFLPAIDVRAGRGVIHSRIGLREDAVVINKEFEFYKMVADWQQTIKNPGAILIDEAQFLTHKQVLSLAKVVDLLGLPVLSYGIRTDFQGNLFEGSQSLLGIADVLSELKTICHCGKKATMNMRIDSDGKQVALGEQVLIGGNERYVAVCRKHFFAGDSGII